jgi:ribonuclease PH
LSATQVAFQFPPVDSQGSGRIQAEVDMNVVMTADGGLIETQATAEKGSFSRSGLIELIDLAEQGLEEIFAAQRALLRT